VVPETITDKLDCVATKEYHTSSSAVPVHPGIDCVACKTVPVTGVQVELGVNENALKHSSFNGCAKALFETIITSEAKKILIYFILS
jgi:hypothetical protein